MLFSSRLQAMGPSEPKRSISLYIHWPWCLSKCPYCDFNSHTGFSDALGDAYVDALLQELHLYRETHLSGRPLVSVYFGGGTPSLMGAGRVGRILDLLASWNQIDFHTEISLECNPTSATPNLFFDLKKAGINRLSLGIQSLQEKNLRFLGREHTLTDAILTLERAFMADFRAVGADLIYGLPGQNLNLWVRDLQNLVRRGLQHVSAYQLTIEPNSAFFADVRRGVWTPADSDTEADFFEATRATLAQEGLENYEISNFSRPGFACAHNVHVWRYGDYIGVGAGAHGRLTDQNGHGFATAVRKMPQDYLRLMREQGEAWALFQPIEKIDSAQEAFLMGLRLRDGIDIAALKSRFNLESGIPGFDADSAHRFVTLGLLEGDPHTHLRLTDRGWPLLNAILSDVLGRAP